ncbi:alpha/beta-hydrolase [Ophiobolus disseminans]|uniref:Carboxylic ester hydrolase n=1 Tax=Ophiobolus disseminans TaxID=1469910 RepID=A0A6A7AI98_9PLEO|nr:alpha/beta-hydrolase [Ophiobolus disseminans]
MRIFLVYCLQFGTLGVASGHTHKAPTATIDTGVVFGKATLLPASLGPVHQFLGIPFAQSPPERFSPAEPVRWLTHPLDATKWKPACLQQFRYPLTGSLFTRSVFNNPPPVESEDCLYLNIYAPSGPHGGRGRAVLFWIFGGSLQFGHAGESAAYDGSSFAAYEDVVVVTSNYRTNLFGFPTDPELPVTKRNLGFLDQRLAMDWVQRNIHAFGGDPRKVTLFGESAGGFSIDAHLTAFPSNSSPPFRAAILQSGQYTYRSAPPVSGAPAWYNLTTQLSCPGTFANNLTCVRAANSTSIQSIINTNTLIFSPTPDNVTYVSDPASRRLTGNIARIPVLGGTNAQEGRLFTVNQTNLTSYLQNTFGTISPSLIPAIRAAYTSNTTNSTMSNATNYDTIARIYTDFVFQCPQALWANATAAAGIPTWRYFFNASFPNTQPYANLGVYHASEVALVFGTYDRANTTTQQYALGRYMMSVWAAFAKNPERGPGWNAVGTGREGKVLVGEYGEGLGGVYGGGNGSVVTGDWNLGVLGDVGDFRGSGVTVSSQGEVDGKCELFREIFEGVVGMEGMPSA